MKNIALTVTIIGLIVSILIGSIGWANNMVNQSKINQIEKVIENDKAQDLKITSMSVDIEYIKKKSDEMNEAQKEILRILRGR